MPTQNDTPSESNSMDMPIPFGLFAETGKPLEGLDPATVHGLCADLSAEPVSPEGLRAKASAGSQFGTIGDVDPQDLSQAGWGVLFGPGVEQRIKDALDPLVKHRQGQVGDERLFRVFDGESGFCRGDTAQTWLDRQHVRMDVVEPLLGVPFYLLIVSAPDEIPFEFQYGLDLYWGVGRLWFNTPEEFRQYADSVVRYETMAAPPTSRQAAVFATDHEFDNATSLFRSQVAQPIVEGTATSGPLGQRQKFAVQPLLGDAATKQALHDIYAGAVPNGPPALLFTGTHGVGYRLDDPRQDTSQGALVCQDWPGDGAVSPDHLFGASDLPANAKVHGMIHVLFACYGAGYPQFDNFDRSNNAPKQIAQQPKICRLPQALLAHRDGGALAVLGHVERAWVYSFQSDRGAPQIQGFRDVIGRMLRGDRLGLATDQFNQRWAALSTELADTLQQMTLGRTDSPARLAGRWIARDDARNYVLLGDPAVRLRTNDMPPSSGAVAS